MRFYEMILDEIFEHGVSIEKTVWKKQGDNVSRQKVQRVVATDIHPRSNIEIKDKKNAG
jgi:hypothetical protein